MRRLSLAGLASVALLASSCGDDAGDGATQRLTIGIANDVFYQCVFDAKVTIRDGRVGEVSEVGEAARDKILPGVEIIGALDTFPQGSVVPVPVHLAGDTLLGGYAYCEQIAK